MKPKVSVCIPAYNSAAYIKDTVMSILNQTYQNIEVIIVDDQSKDNTFEIASSIQDPRIKVYKNEQNLGMVGNWNHCLELATGSFIKLICSDDMLDQNAIEKEANALIENPSANLVESDTRLVDINGKKTGVYKRYPKSGLVDGKVVAKKALVLKNYFGAPVNNMMRREAFIKSGGFDEKFTFILDFDLWLNIACQGDIFIIHELLNSFRIRNDSNTGDLVNNKQDVFVNEHKALVEKYAANDMIKLSKFDMWLSVFIRKVRNKLINIYLKLFAK